MSDKDANDLTTIGATDSATHERLTQALARTSLSVDQAATRATEKIVSAKSWWRATKTFLTLGLVFLTAGFVVLVMLLLGSKVPGSLAVLAGVLAVPAGLCFLLALFCFNQVDGEATKAFLDPLMPLLCRVPILKGLLS